MIKLRRTNGPILTKESTLGYGAIFNAGCAEANGKLYVFARGAKSGYVKKIRKVGEFSVPLTKTIILTSSFSAVGNPKS